MAQLVTVRLSRGDAQPWGLRLQGGKDFGTPLVVQKVNMGSLSDQAGLQVGDAIIKVNNVDAFNLRHKDAQDLIVKSGNAFELTVQRGGGTWRPSVTPTGAVPSPTPNYGGNYLPTVTKTSLAHKQPESKPIGTGYNNAARPFGGAQQQQNGGAPVQSIVNKQYNTPVGIYSEESIAETLSAQAEVLAGGVLGVNFKKNEKVYNSANSEVLKALQEAESEPSEPERHATQSPHYHQPPQSHINQQHQQDQPPLNYQQIKQQFQQPSPQQHQPPQQQQQQYHSHHQPQPQQQNLRAVTPVAIKHVTAPVNQAPAKPAATGPPTGQNICAECERLIVGVFVRIKDKNLHVDCFKCATCGSSLKNQGYFNLNNKLYCDIHAKMAAISNPPPGTKGYEPVPIQPNTKLSASTISAALNAHQVNGSNNYAPEFTNGLAHHSRTSSSASSAGSSYISSTDSNKDSPRKTSPAHSRQSSHSSSSTAAHHPTTLMMMRQSSTENDKNIINANYHHSHVIGGGHQHNVGPTSLPHYQQRLTEQLRDEYNNNHTMFNHPISDDNDDDCDESSSVQSLSPSAFSRGGSGGGGGGLGIGSDSCDHHSISQQQPFAITQKQPHATDALGGSLYGTIRPHQNVQSNHKVHTAPKSAMPEPATVLGHNDEELNYRTLNGDIIRSVQPPGKGKALPYKVNSSLGGPKPFNYGPPAAAPKSPASYPAPAQNAWAQPKPQQQPQYAPAPVANQFNGNGLQQQQPNYGSATLPRPAGHNAPGRYNQPQHQHQPQHHYQAPQHHYNQPAPQHPHQHHQANYGYNNNTNTSSNYYNQAPPKDGRSDDEYASEFSRPSTSLFSWPPPPESDHDAPTASPLYRPPPETQHVHPLPKSKTEPQPPPPPPQPIVPKKSLAQPSRSAPELTAINLREHNEASAESCSDSYTSTCTTTTTTSEEYQRMYQAQQYGSYAQSASDMDCSVDAEMAAYPYGSFSSGTTDLMSFSGRRSVQECAESLSNVVDTSQLVKYLKDLTPAPVSPLSFPKPVKRVEFADPIPHSPVPPVLALQDSSIPNIQPKEWKSQMVQALTTASGETFHLSELPPITDYSYDSPYNRCAHPCERPCDQSCIPPSQQSWQQPQSYAQQPPCSQPYQQPCQTPCELEKEVADINDGQRSFYENQIPAFEPPCFRKVISPYPDQLKSKTKNIQYTPNLTQPQILQEQPPGGSDLTNLLTTASPNPVHWISSTDNVVPPITLPPDTPAYVPGPISMKPYEKEDYTKKSPLLNALVTAPFRSFTPFDHDVITQLEDLPTPKQELRLIDALTVASPTPFQNLGQLPAVTEHERIQNLENERLAQLGHEVNEIISHTVESQMDDRQLSAFAKVPGFRSVHPFQPVSRALPVTAAQDLPDPRRVSYVDSQPLPNTNPSVSSVVPRSIIKPSCPSPAVSFPPPLGVPLKQFVQSGLHEPSTIPKYQRQWFNLASQSPVRTPEPHELKENVPLAFVEPHPPTSSTFEQQQLNYSSEVREALAAAAVTVSVTDTSSSSSYAAEQASTYAQQQQIYPQTQSTDSSALHSQQQQQQRHRTASPAARPYTPSLINKPAPTIPYYQQNLVAEECEAPNTHLFLDPRIDSPMPDRCPSPAPGPPPNPLRIHAPRMRSPDRSTDQSRSTSILSNYQPSPGQTLSSSYQSSAASNLAKPITLDGGATLLAQSQSLQQSGAKSFVDRPEIVQQRTVGDTTVQSRSKQSQLNEEQRANYESASTTQIGNTQVQRKTRVVEEFEHSQKASTVEIYKSSGGGTQSQARSITGSGQGSGGQQNFASYKNQPKVTAAELQSVQTNQQDGFSCYKSSAANQQQLQRSQPPQPPQPGTARGAPLGFVAREARRLSSNSQYKVDLATYESKFPQCDAPTPGNQFPLKTFHPITEEPKAQTYNVSKKQPNKPPPGYQQIQPDLKYTTRSSLAQPPPNPKLIQTTTNQRVKASSSAIAAASSSSSAYSSSTKQLTSSQNTAYQQQQLHQLQQQQQHTLQQLPKYTQQPQQTQRTPTPHTSFPPPILPAQPPHTSFPPPQPTIPSYYSPAPPASTIGAYQPAQTPGVPPTSKPFASNYNLGSSTGPSAFKPPPPQASAPLAAYVPPKPQPPKPSAVTVSDPNPASAGAAPAGPGAPGAGNKALKFGATSAPKRGRGVLNQAGTGGRVPQCGCCSAQIRGPFITALGKIWCPDHFVCVSQDCRRPLQDIGFVEEKGDLYCEYCFEKYLAPPCDKCNAKIKGDCLNAIGKHFHPECFTCTYCGKLFGNSPFFLEEGQAYCEADWNELFTTKCFACGFPVEAGDRWVEALSHNYHSQCFNCTMCKKNLEGQSFFAKGGRPYCKAHAR